MSILRCQSLTVTYADVVALDEVDLEVAEGETVAVLGPSGSGKSTLMYAVAGMVRPVAGTIELAGEVVSTLDRQVPPEQRPVGMVFQNYALWPHLTALETVAYPIRRRGKPKRDARAEAAQLLDLVGIGGLSHRRPAELSGGEQQRVGLARALARQADLYLFDEPTAHLDSAVRVAVEAEIARRRAESGAAAIYSTHDSAEALAVADRVALLRSGRLIQFGTPRDVYEQPADVWAAHLTGPTSVAQRDERLIEDVAGSASGRLVVVRPEWLEPSGPVAGVVINVAYRGTRTDYVVDTALGWLHPRHDGPPRWSEGDDTTWRITRGWCVDSNDSSF